MVFGSAATRSPFLLLFVFSLASCVFLLFFPHCIFAVNTAVGYFALNFQPKHTHTSHFSLLLLHALPTTHIFSVCVCMAVCACGCVKTFRPDSSQFFQFFIQISQFLLIIATLSFPQLSLFLPSLCLWSFRLLHIFKKVDLFRSSFKATGNNVLSAFV